MHPITSLFINIRISRFYTCSYNVKTPTNSNFHSYSNAIYQTDLDNIFRLCKVYSFIKLSLQPYDFDFYSCIYLQGKQKKPHFRWYFESWHSVAGLQLAVLSLLNKFWLLFIIFSPIFCFVYFCKLSHSLHVRYFHGL